MVRKQIYLEDRQEVQLKQLAKAFGVSEAMLIRQSLDRGVLSATSSHLDLSSWQREKKFIRKRMQKGPLTGKRSWKREDLYER